MSVKLRKKKQSSQEVTLSGVARNSGNPFSILEQYLPLSTPEIKLYEAIREGVPIIDSAILKTVRLVGGFQVVCENQRIQKLLDQFVETVNVGGTSIGLESFLAFYLDSLLTYGNAIGEIVLSEDLSEVVGIYHAGVSDVQIKRGNTPMDVDYYVQDSSGKLQKVWNKNLILFTALNPKAGEITGVSVLRSLPFVTSILFKIYHSIGQNFDRVGNIRYAVTYKPSGDAVDKAYAKERARMIAKEWADGMRAGADGQVKDFITVGDVNIKVIGADNQILDTDIPVRHMMEQILSKMGIPPFLLGLSWSTTERMSQQQTDILTTELEYYRRLLTPIILKICSVYLRLHGLEDHLSVRWNTINLKDEIEQAQARWYLAKAKQIEENLQGGNQD